MTKFILNVRGSVWISWKFPASWDRSMMTVVITWSHLSARDHLFQRIFNINMMWLNTAPLNAYLLFHTCWKSHIHFIDCLTKSHPSSWLRTFLMAYIFYKKIDKCAKHVEEQWLVVLENELSEIQYIPWYRTIAGDMFMTWWRHQMETFSALLVLCAGIHRSPVNSPHKGQWRGDLMFSLMWAWTNGWANSRQAGDLRSHRVTSVMH